MLMSILEKTNWTTTYIEKWLEKQKKLKTYKIFSIFLQKVCFFGIFHFKNDTKNSETNFACVNLSFHNLN